MSTKEFGSGLGFADLHNHLYGSLRPELLWKMGLENPSPRWEIFTKPFQELYGKRIHTETFFEDYKAKEDFEKIYLFNHQGPFPEFQAKFNLIIALSKFNPEEIRSVSKRVTKDQFEEGVTFGEYRIMYAPNDTYEGIYSKTLAACEGFAEAEAELGDKASSRLVISLHRDGDVFREYDMVKEMMEKNSLIRKYTVGLDFCYIEEGFPPKDKKEFLGQVQKDNRAETSTALTVLYHVGESFQDKTLLSASRWVLESAEWGAHRLGHAIALGMDPNAYAGKTVTETSSERKDTLLYLLDHWEEVSKYGEISSRERLSSELDSIRHKEKMEISITETQVSETKAFQEYCMDRIRNTHAIIESCPSSNEYIGMVRDRAHHPLIRFARHGLKFTISTDDPGIFGTDIREEYRKAESLGLSQDQLEKVRRDSFLYTSEILSGRIPVNDEAYSG
ncbi:adenosine deaminase [Leptospira langatensis]|uniref:adenosine deaminase n=1 Tax=Leptospira langatensis TaxID=2484983 RepID=A0A5F1ZX66_9LEPT|nr:adenosine deaminase [Leptospira langatensis]TGK01371.1 adenosine deaminase [Leptospira langatensis]TGL42177.1 adenosine deaminase [Leptospira langatensis]